MRYALSTGSNTARFHWKRERVMRAGANYLRTIGVTEDAIPDTDTLVRFLKLTVDVMAQKT